MKKDDLEVVRESDESLTVWRDDEPMLTLTQDEARWLFVALPALLSPLPTVRRKAMR